MATTLSMFTLYRDPAAAVTWLVNAFGFEIAFQFGAEEGTVDSSTNRAPVLCLDDESAVDALYERAVAAGATTLRKPETTEWGNHRFEVLDLEGHQWSVGSYRPGQAW